MTPVFDPIELEILWSRVVGVVDDSVDTLVRTAFSPSVREGNDMTCALMDVSGRTIAQSLTSTPLHTGVKSFTMRSLLKRYPASTWRPGDAAISNDPWVGTGHRFDVTIVRPIFHKAALVGFALNDAHWGDIGGGGLRVENRDVYEEGLGIPDLKVLREGEPVEEVFEFIRLNTRSPQQTLGDLHGQLVASARLAASTVELLDEAGLTDLDGLATAIFERSERSMRAAIGRLKPGTYVREIDADALEHPLHLRVAVTVRRDRVDVDYAGSAPQSRNALNATWTYTYAWTVFALKATLEPDTPNNDGCLVPFSVTAPEGSVLNPRWGAPVSFRSQTGHYIPTLVLSALADAAVDLVPAEPGSPPHRSVIVGAHDNGDDFSMMINASGGLGASSRGDGLHCTAFPTNTLALPVEVLEQLYPLRIWERELLTDSGGPGRHRGGCGQRLVFEYVGKQDAHLSPMLERMTTPPAGLAGGLPGSTASMEVNGRPLRSKAQITIRPGDRIEVRTCGGGGFGPPRERPSAAVDEDVRDGVVSREAAIRWYGREPGAVRLDA